MVSNMVTLSTNHQLEISYRLFVIWLMHFFAKGLHTCTAVARLVVYLCVN